MATQNEPIDFRGGALASAVPLLVFVGVTIVLVLAGAPEVNGMIVGAMLGISVGMVFARNISAYGERVFSLMVNRTAAVAIVCWLWAGAFSGILADAHLVEGIVWIGWKLGLAGRAFTVAVFICAGLFAVSLGTGLGTVLGFTAVMYPVEGILEVLLRPVRLLADNEQWSICLQRGINGPAFADDGELGARHPLDVMGQVFGRPLLPFPRGRGDNNLRVALPA